MQVIDSAIKTEIYSVTRLNGEVRTLLEGNFSSVWIDGEISNFSAPSSGHWYFSLKDRSAQVNCAMFRSHRSKVNFLPKDGAHVLIRARVSLYETTGRFQLIADHMEERGEGKLQRAFEMLKKKLEAAGLFDAQHKKTLPAFPRQIGVITSATGAAIRDILTVLKRRYAAASVVIYPTLVQGQTAAPTIVNAIETANRRQECDVLILARGGGSLEDLWPFNEEMVAQAIFKSQLPMVSAIGHEVDFTIADFVADCRAPTPSAAAEIVVPDHLDLLQNLARQSQQIERLINSKTIHLKQKLSWVEKHLNQQHPKRRLNEKMQQLDVLEMTLQAQLTKKIHHFQQQYKQLHLHLLHTAPQKKIQNALSKTIFCEQKITTLMQNQIHFQQNQLGNAAHKLDALSPLATLKRGYAIALTPTQTVIRDASQLKQGERIQVRLLKNSADCIVEKIIQLDE